MSVLFVQPFKSQGLPEGTPTCNNALTLKGKWRHSLLWRVRLSFTVQKLRRLTETFCYRNCLFHLHALRIQWPLIHSRLFSLNECLWERSVCFTNWSENVAFFSSTAMTSCLPEVFGTNILVLNSFSNTCTIYPKMSMFVPNR